MSTRPLLFARCTWIIEGVSENRGPMDFGRIFAVEPASRRIDMGLLCLRVSFGLSLLLKHGIEKVTGFNEMAKTFPDPFHLGLHVSLAIATASDVIAASMLIAGFATRPAAVFIACNIGVAWVFVHQAQFFGPNADHGELCVLYLCGCLAILLGGAGRFSIDARLDGRK